LVLDSVLPGTAPGTLLQLLIAFAFCLLTLLLTAVASPFKSDVDDAVAKAFGIALVAVFFFALIIKVNVLTDSVDEYLPKQLQSSFALDIVVVSIGMTIAVALALVVTVLVAVQQLVHAARTPVIKLRSTSSRPALTVENGIVWQLFLSHIWSTGQDQVFQSRCPFSLALGSPHCTRASARPRTPPSSVSSACSCRASQSSWVSRLRLKPWEHANERTLDAPLGSESGRRRRS